MVHQSQGKIPTSHYVVDKASCRRSRIGAITLKLSTNVPAPIPQSQYDFGNDCIAESQNKYL